MDLASQPIAVMEPAIVARLRLAFPEAQFQIQRVPPVLTDMEFKRVVRLTPFIGLAWLGMKPDTGTGRELRGAMQWRLVLIVKASSSIEARFKGDRRDIGLDAMVDVATVLLNGVTFDIGHSTVTRAEGVFADGWADDATVIAQVDFEIRFATRVAGLGLTTLDDFRSLGITWLNAASPDPEDDPEMTTEESFEGAGDD